MVPAGVHCTKKRTRPRWPHGLPDYGPRIAARHIVADPHRGTLIGFARGQNAELDRARSSRHLRLQRAAQAVDFDWAPAILRGSLGVQLHHRVRMPHHHSLRSTARSAMSGRRDSRRRRSAPAVAAGALLLGTATILFLAPVAAGRPGGGQTQVPATLQDFLQPGTQPDPSGLEFARIYPSTNCTFCHSEYSPTFAPFDSWVTSAMAQSARDPVWHAALAIANQDVHLAGEFCIRCHSPGAWLGGRSSSGTIDDFIYDDFDGINCHFCHRVVNPVLGAGSAVGYPDNADPTPDVEIITALQADGLLPTGHGNGRYVVDPRDVRRGPFSDVPINYHGISELGEPVDLITSPFHRSSDFCGTCHDVSNPVFVKQPNGTYAVGRLDAPHPTQDPMDMFPEQRTYSEWANSEFATTGVSFPDNRFGGANTGPMHSCQDCHMPDQVGGGCVFWENPPFFQRPDMPQHSFLGSNTWMVDAVAYQLGGDAESLGLTTDRLDAARARNSQFLRDASDMELSQAGGQLKVRVINQTGHKLPTGYPEGRRIWVNVRFYDDSESLVAERGAYDDATAELTTADTKVYEARHGIDESVAALTGLPAGENFRLALANTKFKDNRIPPRGFTNAAFAAAGCPPVDAVYADGQYWDDTLFAIPPGATHAVVTLYYQTSTKEYMDFLRDANVTNTAGQTAHDLWVQFGRSAPVAMDSAMLVLGPANPADLNGDGHVDGADLGLLIGNWGNPGVGDYDQSGAVDGADLGFLIGNWG